MKIYNDKDSKTNFASTRAISLNSCGFQCYDSQLFGVERQHRVDYHILLMKTGHCTVYYEGKMYTLNENDGILYLPGQIQKYYFLEGKTESYWVHFSGTECEKLLNSCRLSGGIFHTHAVNDIFWTFERLRRLKKQERACTELCRIGTLLELLGYIGRDLSDDRKSDTVENGLMNFIHLHYFEPIDFKLFAKENGLSLHRLSERFKALTGLTPHKYRLQLQLVKAKQLLTKSDLNISEIAIEVGFSDPLYFSRVFKSNIGCSPKNYR